MKNGALNASGQKNEINDPRPMRLSPPGGMYAKIEDYFLDYYTFAYSWCSIDKPQVENRRVHRLRNMACRRLDFSGLLLWVPHAETIMTDTYNQ